MAEMIFKGVGGLFQLASKIGRGSSKKNKNKTDTTETTETKDKVNNLSDKSNVSDSKSVSVYGENDSPSKKSGGIKGFFGLGSKSSKDSTGDTGGTGSANSSIDSKPDSNTASVYDTNDSPYKKPGGIRGFFGLGSKSSKDSTSDKSEEKSNEDSKPYEPQVMPGGMPCKFELLMEFFSTFLFTFIIYFCVFAFVPYEGLIAKILEFIRKITKKFTDFLYSLVPKSVKKAFSKLFPKSIVKFFKVTLPNLISKKKDEITTPLKEKLQKIKDDVDEKINKERKNSKKNKNFLSDLSSYYNEQYLIVKSKVKEIWEKFKDKIIPALIISLIYYVIWLVFFKIIPVVLKYLINVAQQFKQP